MLKTLAVLTMLCVTPISASLGGTSDLPDPKLTPGKWRDDLSLAQICATQWGTDERLVTDTMKKAVMAAYHMTPASCPSGKIEIDHLVSRELGGADVVENLWPQCYEKPVADPAHPGKFLAPSLVPEWGAHKKDRLENDLGTRICLPATDPKYLNVAVARGIETTNWIVGYIQRYGDPRVKAVAP